MDKIAIAKRTGNFLNADLDDLVNSTGMYRMDTRFRQKDFQK